MVLAEIDIATTVAHSTRSKGVALTNLHNVANVACCTTALLLACNHYAGKVAGVDRDVFIHIVSRGGRKVEHLRPATHIAEVDVAAARYAHAVVTRGVGTDDTVEPRVGKAQVLAVVHNE